MHPDGGMATELSTWTVTVLQGDFGRPGQVNHLESGLLVLR